MKGRLEHPREGTLLIDRYGNLEHASPRVLSERRSDNGTVTKLVCFSSQAQMDGYVAHARAQGISVSGGAVIHQRRFVLDGAPMALAFGGPDAFRATARIALNLLAFSLPAVAREPVLDPLKEFVRFGCLEGPGDSRHVWYIDPQEPSFPLPHSPLLHQVLVCVQDGVAFARVRFFSILELAVWFGEIPGVADTVVLHEIDPLAERPCDFVARLLDPELVRLPVTRPTVDRPMPQPDRARFIRLFRSVGDEHWKNASAPTLAKLETARALTGWRRHDLVHEALGDHGGRMLHLALSLLERIQRDFQHLAGADMIVEALSHFLQSDPEQPSGVTAPTRAALALMHHALTNAVVGELSVGPISSERLRLLLEGGPGASVVGRTLLEPIFAALEHHAGEVGPRLDY
jgi:hypothetical protein